MISKGKSDKDSDNPDDYTRETADFNTTFSGYTLSEDEIAELRAGYQVMVTATGSSGDEFTCNLALEITEYNGNRAWRLKPIWG